MDDFLAKAGSMLNGAHAAAQAGLPTEEWTVLVGENSLHLIADSRIPLESLRLERRAKEAFRIKNGPGALVVEACKEKTRVCLSQEVNRRMPGTFADVVLYDVLPAIPSAQALAMLEPAVEAVSL